jgi:hypothetical protein
MIQNPKFFKIVKCHRLGFCVLRSAILLTWNWRLPLQYRMCPVSDKCYDRFAVCGATVGSSWLQIQDVRKGSFSGRLLSAHENAAVLLHNWPMRLPFSSISHPTAGFCTVMRSWPGSQDSVWTPNSLTSWTLPLYVWRFNTCHVCQTLLLNVKGKAVPLQAWTGLRVPGVWGSQISRQSAHEGGKVVSPTNRPSLPPGNIPGTH